MMGDRESRLAALKQRFLTQLHRDHADIQYASTLHDWPSIADIAHRVAGLAGSLGFPELSDRAKELDLRARADDGVEREAAYVAFLQSLYNNLDAPD